MRRPEPRDDGHGFGVVTADVNNDGLIDIFVANDMNPNFLFLNRGDGTFDDVSEISGAAFNKDGNGPVGDGGGCRGRRWRWPPRAVRHQFRQRVQHALPELRQRDLLRQHAVLRPGVRLDAVGQVGLRTGGLRQRRLAGLLLRQRARRQQPALLGQPVDYEEIPLLFRNISGKRFRLATRDAGPYFDTKHVGRGAAFGDIDNDGDIDIVVNHKDGAPAVLRNDTKSDNHWIRFALQGTKSNRDAIGDQARGHDAGLESKKNTTQAADDLPAAQRGL